jgi:hypothetical protein
METKIKTIIAFADVLRMAYTFNKTRTVTVCKN